MISIPFNRPSFVGKELHYISQAIHGLHASGNGYFTKQCQEFLERMVGSPSVLLTTSCTDALEMSAILLNIEPGDEVIVPSFTFVSTANAFALRGATLVFVDVRPDTLNMDELQLERLITSKTKAIVPVHYGGVGCEMDIICDIATRHNVAVVEDNAHGLFGSYRGRNLGTFGSLATLSFHETKNVSCGEGGALLVNDPEHIERAEIIWEKGTNRSRFLRGQVDKYTWVDVGSSFLPSDILAAFLFAQLESRDWIQSRRQRIWKRYEDDLQDWARSHDVGLPAVPEHCQQSYHLFYLVLPSGESRDALIDHLKSQGILSVFHYLPLHLSPMGRQFGGRVGDCPVTEHISERLVRLPFYNDMSDEDQARVIKAVKSFSHTESVGVSIDVGHESRGTGDGPTIRGSAYD